MIRTNYHICLNYCLFSQLCLATVSLQNTSEIFYFYTVVTVVYVNVNEIVEKNFFVEIVYNKLHQ